MNTIYLVMFSIGSYDEAVESAIAWFDDESDAKRIASTLDESARQMDSAYRAWLKANPPPTVSWSQDPATQAPWVTWRESQRAEIERLNQNVIAEARIHQAWFGHVGLTLPSYDVSAVEKWKAR